MNIIDVLGASELFSTVSPAAFRRLATIGRICDLRKGHVIFREGDPCPGVYVVGRGLVRVFQRGPTGKEHVLHMVGAGDTFAEVAAIGDFPLPASAEAVKRTTCALLPIERFRAAMAEDHNLCLGMMTSMCVWVRRLVQLIEDITLRDAAGRVARHLLELQGSPPGGDGTVKLPGLKRYVASHLNLTSETLSRTLRRLVEAGLIAEVDKDRVRLVHPRKLHQVAEGFFPSL
jgi:CRP/FNR family transcriptional regulator, dissimilatory nitrate respiration regulator